MSGEDELILVDLLDRETGTAGKMRCHEEGLLHRAFSVFLVHGDEILLQRRAKGKYHSGGLWTNSCCSHPRQGESLPRAVERRLSEELGVTGVDCEEVGSFVYRQAFENGIVEFEYDHIFVGFYDGQVEPDPEEADAVAWVALGDVLADLQSRPERYSSWFMTAAPLVAAWLDQLIGMAR